MNYFAVLSVDIGVTFGSVECNLRILHCSCVLFALHDIWSKDRV